MRDFLPITPTRPPPPSAVPGTICLPTALPKRWHFLQAWHFQNSALDHKNYAELPKRNEVVFTFSSSCSFCLTSNRKFLETSQRMAGLVRHPNQSCRRHSLGTFEVWVLEAPALPLSTKFPITKSQKFPCCLLVISLSWGLGNGKGGVQKKATSLAPGDLVQWLYKNMQKIPMPYLKSLRSYQDPSLNPEVKLQPVLYLEFILMTNKMYSRRGETRGMTPH